MNPADAHEFNQSKTFVQLPTITYLRISGEDRQTVLNSLCTADLRKFEPGDARETFITDVRGKCIGHGIVFSGMDEALFFLGIGSQATALLPHFDKYVIREDMKVEDRSPSTTAFLISGGNPEMLPTPLRPTKPAASEAAEKLHVAIHPYVAGSHTAYILDAKWTSDLDRLLIQDAEDAAVVSNSLADEGYSESDYAAYDLARIRYGWPHFGSDFDATNLPQEVDRDRFAISFTKGCYLGQETVARLDALGQVQKKLVTWKVESNVVPDPGTVLEADDKNVGTVRSAAWDAEQNATLAIAMTRRSHFTPGSVAKCDGVDAVVLPTP